MFSSSDYKTAAAVLDREKLPGYVELTEELMAKAAKASRLEDYLAGLADVIDHRRAPLGNGLYVWDRLIADGWTPPEGLL